MSNLSAFIDGKDKPLRVAELPISKPGLEDIVVRNRAVAINIIDPAQRAGYQIKQYPAVVGMDLAGDVHEDVVLPLAIDTAAGGFYQSDYMGLDFPYSTTKRNSKGEVVVVYGGSSSVGCAAIQLAVNAGYRVFATARPNHFVSLPIMNAWHALFLDV
ncbi:hypothetical protein LTR49_022507 [Elasticomyces elasticus]|nr:hypothetical protein LTR49_022507 [Elasticomyces elasticus]